MTSFVEIQAAIVSKLRKIDSEVEINSSDIEEGFKRPCFYVDMLKSKISNLMDKFQDKNLEFDILYFPKHPKKNQMDLLEMRDKLTESFVQNSYFNIVDDLVVQATDVDIFETDKVLHCKFNIFISEEYVRTYEFNMEELDLKEGINANK